MGLLMSTIGKGCLFFFFLFSDFLPFLKAVFIFGRRNNNLELFICIIGSSQMLSYAMGAVYQQFVKEDMKDFDAFHMAVLDVFT